MKKYVWMFLAMGLFVVGCKKNDDTLVDPDVMVDPVMETKVRADYPVQDFMWQAMNIYYFYLNNVPNLDENRYDTLEDYVDFIASEPNPEDFFFDKLVYTDDRFSFLNEDYKVLTQGFSGISKSNGLEFGLSLFGDDNDVFGYVQYVVKNSDASSKDIKRGDVFVTVNGTQLFYNSASDNNLDLLFENDSYTLGMADIVNNTITPNNKEVSLTKQAGLVEDPIHVNKVLDIGGTKVGYLMFNQFAGNSGEPLNEAFGGFKSAGITDLVLDLRYNPGGFGYITQILGSLIHRPDTDKVFYNRRFNAKLEEAWDVVGGDKTNFVADTGTFDGNSNIPLNSLDLKKIYVIATGNSASASELLINGLRPYVEVVHIGSTTVGKNQGSFTFVDDPENGFFHDPDREDKINPNNQWAIQPIASQTENSEGFGDYADGLVPTIAIDEDIDELGILGDISERMLARAIQEIDASSAKKDLTAKFPIDLISSSSLHKTGGGQLNFREVPSTLKGKFNTGIK